MTRFLARELSAAHWFNIAAARRDLGYQPSVSIEEGMQRLEQVLLTTAPGRVMPRCLTRLQKFVRKSPCLPRPDRGKPWTRRYF